MHNQSGILFVLSAPAGTGKTTLVRLLCQEFPHVVESVSFTTRPQRPGEEEGKDYFYVTKEEFEKRKKSGDFLEFATVFGYDYGTSKEMVERSLRRGQHVFLVIDTQGALQVAKKVDAVLVFMSPPSVETLQKRLHGRNRDQSEDIDLRLSWAEREMALVSEYDYHVVNDDLQKTLRILQSIVVAEEHKVK